MVRRGAGRDQPDGDRMRAVTGRAGRRWRWCPTRPWRGGSRARAEHLALAIARADDDGRARAAGRARSGGRREQPADDRRRRHGLREQLAADRPTSSGMSAPSPSDTPTGRGHRRVGDDLAGHPPEEQIPGRQEPRGARERRGCVRGQPGQLGRHRGAVEVDAAALADRLGPTRARRQIAWPRRWRVGRTRDPGTDRVALVDRHDRLARPSTRWPRCPRTRPGRRYAPGGRRATTAGHHDVGILLDPARPGRRVSRAARRPTGPSALPHVGLGDAGAQVEREDHRAGPCSRDARRAAGPPAGSGREPAARLGRRPTRRPRRPSRRRPRPPSPRRPSARGAGRRGTGRVHRRWRRRAATASTRAARRPARPAPAP